MITRYISDADFDCWSTPSDEQHLIVAADEWGVEMFRGQLELDGDTPVQPYAELVRMSLQETEWLRFHLSLFSFGGFNLMIQRSAGTLRLRYPETADINAEEQLFLTQCEAHWLLSILPLALEAAQQRYEGPRNDQGPPR